MADKPSSLAPLRQPGVEIRDRELDIAVSVFDEMVRRKQLRFFAASLPPEVVRDHLARHLTSESERALAGRAEKRAVAQKRRDEREAAELLSRLSSLTDAAYPLGSEERGDFFVVGPGEQPDSVQLTAMADGIARHGLPALPEAITEAVIRAQAQRLGVVEVARTSTGKLRESVATVRKNLRPRTVEIARRLAAVIHGHYGRHSLELAAYGLKVHAVRRPRRKSPPVVMVVPASPPRLTNGAASQA